MEADIYYSLILLFKKIVVTDKQNHIILATTNRKWTYSAEQVVLQICCLKSLFIRPLNIPMS